MKKQISLLFTFLGMLFICGCGSVKNNINYSNPQQLNNTINTSFNTEKYIWDNIYFSTNKF